MTDDFIRREDALNELCKYCIRNGSCAVKCAEFENVQSISAADVREVVHARWVSYGIGRGKSFCSNCQHNGEKDMRFCPDCGAVMDEENKEGD